MGQISLESPLPLILQQHPTLHHFQETAIVCGLISPTLLLTAILSRSAVISRSASAMSASMSLRRAKGCISSLYRMDSWAHLQKLNAAWNGRPRLRLTFSDQLPAYLQLRPCPPILPALMLPSAE